MQDMIRPGLSSVSVGDVTPAHRCRRKNCVLLVLLMSDRICFSGGHCAPFVRDPDVANLLDRVNEQLGLEVWDSLPRGFLLCEEAWDVAGGLPPLQGARRAAVVSGMGEGAFEVAHRVLASSYIPPASLWHNPRSLLVLNSYCRGHTWN